MASPIVIYGAGGHAREVAHLLHAQNGVGSSWDVLGFVTDDRSEWGNPVAHRSVLGDWRAVAQIDELSVALGVGDSAARRDIVTKLQSHRPAYPSLVYPSVSIEESVNVGAGVVIGAGAVLTIDVQVADFSLVNLGCTIGHDATIGRFASLAPGVHVSGNAHVGEGAFVGTGAVLLPGVRVGAWSVVGAGAVVTKDVPDGCTAVGVPARTVEEATRESDRSP